MAKDLFHAPEFLELIDWHNITATLCSNACFDYTIEYFNSCEAFLKPDQLDQELRRQDCLHQLQNATAKLTGQLARLGEKFISTASKELTKGRVPSVFELHQLALLMEADEIWQNSFAHDLESDELLLFRTTKIYNKNILISLREFIDENGAINERGFKEMRLLTDALLQLEASARKRAGELLRQSEKHYGSSGEFDIINDRYVLPVPSDRYTSSYGPIVHRSRTGMTLMVEPVELKAFSIKRAELLAERDWLIFKKCRECGELLSPYAADFDQWSTFALYFDRLQTLASWAQKSRLSRPKLSTQMGIELKGLFHPLVKDCISNDISINNDIHGVILSGPNTGGKTVLLKSVALSVALLKVGSWLPCTSASIYPYSQLYFFSHDLQDINEGLSSFSSEVKNYSSLIDDIEKDALVIIDEIFNSTSSEEASALAVALLEHLENTASPHILLSTHHHGIKTTASNMKNFVSSHMAVDSHGQPLYQVVWGTPGSSRGIDTFKRLSSGTSWGNSISKRAKELLGSNIFDYESALTEINSLRADYILKQKEVENQIDALKNEKQAFGLQKETVLQQQQLKLLKQYESIVAKAQDEIDRFKRDETSSRRTLDVLAQGKRELKPKSPLSDKTPEQLKELPTNCQDQRVWSLGLGKSGNVLQDKGSKLLVDFNGLRSWCKRSDLLAHAQNQVIKQNISVHVQREVLGKTSLDCRGSRLETFQSDVSLSLQELVSGDIPYLDIIHGHGDGVLKKWLRQYLKHEQDLEWSPLDGNDGATRVELKK